MRRWSLSLALLLGACRSPPRHESVTVLLNDDILSLDPNQEVEQVTDLVLSNVYEPLITVDGDMQPRLGLAESWEHPEPERWRFELRKGVHFQDGTPLTAEAVRDALLALKGNPELEAAQYLMQVREITASSENSLDLVTDKPTALLASLPFLYVSKKNAAGAFPPLVGTGPYRVREWGKGQQVVLETWDGYWGPRPALRQASFVPIKDPEARIERLRAGSADLVYDVAPHLTRTAIPGVRFARRSSVSVIYIGFALGPAQAKSPFSDVRVRRAIHLGVDRKKLLSEGLLGLGSVATQAVAPLVYGFDPNLPDPAHDPETARRLLKDAGHAAGLSARLDLALRWQPMAEALRDDLSQIGVKLTLNTLERRAFYDLGESGKSQLWLTGWDCSSGEASELYEVVLHTPREHYGMANYGGYSNPRIDAIADTNATILDPLARRRALQDAARIVLEDLPLVPLLVPDVIFGVREGLEFPPRADGEVRLADVRWRQGS